MSQPRRVFVGGLGIRCQLLLTWKERVKAARGAARMHWLRIGAETARMASIVTILDRDRGYQSVKGPRVTLRKG